MKEVSVRSKTREEFIIIDSHIRGLIEKSGRDEGVLTVFIPHTTAAVTVNENADPTVRQDMESHFNVIVPENASYYIHTYEGSDDMPAHIKAVLLGSSLTIPISDGNLNLGTWQGIYLCEHRNRARSRRLVVTVHGE